MKIKLTKENFEGYKKRILATAEQGKKIMAMEEWQNKILLPALEEAIKRAPNAKNPKHRS